MKKKKIKWQYGIWKEWEARGYKEKIWHYDDGCYKIVKERGKFRLTVGWTVIKSFKKLSSAKKVAELIKFG